MCYERLVKRWRLAVAGLVVWAAGLALLDAAFFKLKGPPPHFATLLPLSPKASSPKSLALVVNGGLGLGMNYPRYWNNLSLATVAFKMLGYRTVAALDGDGAPGVPDRSVNPFLGLISTGDYDDSPFDLDADGTPDVQGPATRARLETALADIGKTMGEGDSLVLYLIDHGQLRLRDGALTAVFMLWNEEIFPDELEAMIARHIPKGAWVAVGGSMCHSDIFFRDFQRPRTLVLAAGRPLWIWSTQTYSIFAYHFFAALLGIDPENGKPVRADENGDGRVTLREAVRHAARADHSPEWPKAWVNGDDSTAPEHF